MSPAPAGCQSGRKGRSAAKRNWMRHPALAAVVLGIILLVLAPTNTTSRLSHQQDMFHL